MPTIPPRPRRSVLAALLALACCSRQPPHPADAGPAAATPPGGDAGPGATIPPAAVSANASGSASAADAGLSCTGGVCQVTAITAEVQAELEARPDRATLTVVFRKGTDDAAFATIARVPWVTRVLLEPCESSEKHPCGRVTDLSPLASLAGLRYLHTSSTAVRSLEPLAHLGSLAELIMVDDEGPSDLSPLPRIGSLRQLQLHHARAPVDLSPLAGMDRLEMLVLSRSAVVHFDVVPRLRGLAILSTPLHADGAPFANLRALSTMHGLHALDVSGTTATDFSPLAQLVGLGQLTARGCAGLSDLAWIRSLAGLWELNLTGDAAVSDLRPVAALTKLTILDLDGTSVADLGPVAKLTKLQTLSLGKTRVHDLAPVAHLDQLKMLKLDDTAVDDLGALPDAGSLAYLIVPKGVPAAQVAALKAARPGLVVIGP